jgi:hypothetical protein
MKLSRRWTQAIGIFVGFTKYHLEATFSGFKNTIIMNSPSSFLGCFHHNWIRERTSFYLPVTRKLSDLAVFTANYIF